MVRDMLKNKQIYKGSDFLNNNFKERMNNYFNPYEYNFESNLKEYKNLEYNFKSKSHEIRKKIK